MTLSVLLMSVIYFDRNVFDHLCTLNCGVTEGDVAKIQQAVDSGAITIPASYTVVEETIPLIRLSEEKYEQHIQTVLCKPPAINPTSY
jgi:hypothetical protein